MEYHIHSGKVSSGLTLSDYDYMYISSGGTANNTTINGWGWMNIISGGLANYTTINNGYMYINDGGSANSTTVNSNGFMGVLSGGTATNIIWTPCVGRVAVDDGAYVTYASNYSGVYFGSDNQLLSHTQSMSGKVVSGLMYVMDGGVANSTTVNYGYMYISSGGTANSTTVNRGSMFIYSGGTAKCTTVNSNGYMYISSGGTANSTTVNSGGGMHIFSGGTATDIVAQSGASLGITVAPDTYIQGTYNGSAFEMKNATITGYTINSGSLGISGGTANCTTVNSSGYMFIESGGTANNTTVNSSGHMCISSGGTANSTTVNSWGRMDIYSGGTANSTTVNSNGRMFIESGGTANNTTVNSGYMCISSGGTANNITVNSGGSITIRSGGVANSLTLSAGANLGSFDFAEDKYFAKITNGSAIIADNVYIVESKMYISSGGTANSTTINSWGYIDIYSGGTANDTTVNANGDVYISSGGTANNTTVNYGEMYIYGIANSTTFNSSGYMFIESGGTANNTTINKGSMNITSGGTANNTTINQGTFNIGGYYYGGGAASNTTVNSGGKMYLSSGSVHHGSLQIAGGAVVKALSGSVIDFTVAGQKATDGYLINDLSLIQGAPTYTITVDNDPTNGTYKLAQGANNFSGTLTIGNGTVDYGTITVNGADFVHNGVTYSLDNVSGNLTLTVSGGKTAAVDGDLDGNGLADVILVHTKQGYSGAWLTTGTSSVIKWGNLGNVNSKVELVGMGNVNGTSTNGSDIIMKIGTTVAAWVTDGGKVKSYKELYTLKSNMNMLGIGDFDGDGVTDYLLRSTAGDLGYVTGDDNKWHYIKGLGKEWKIAAVGDLDGNGTDDVIVRHDAGFTGAYMIDENGKITWSSLDTLKSDMTLVGTGDFNGDGVDDVLLQNKSNGWVGAWLVEDGRVDSFIGLCNNKNTIEQIADFNGDGIDDLRIRTEKGDIGVLYVNGADDTTWQYFQSVGKEWDTSFALIS